MRNWIGVLIIFISFWILFFRGLKNKNSTSMILVLGILAILTGLSIANIDSLKTLSAFGLKMETINQVKKDVYAKAVTVNGILDQVKLSEKRINKLFQYSLKIKNLSSKITINMRTKSTRPEKQKNIMGKNIYLAMRQDEDDKSEQEFTNENIDSYFQFDDGKGNTRIEGNVIMTPGNLLANKKISILENYNNFIVWILMFEKDSIEDIQSIDSVKINFYINQIEIAKIEMENLEIETIGKGENSYKALHIKNQPIFANIEKKLLEIIESN